jgi:hypothetical protein
LASSTVGWTASIGPGAWWRANPIQMLPASVAPTYAAFMNTMRCVGSPGDSPAAAPALPDRSTSTGSIDRIEFAGD